MIRTILLFLLATVTLFSQEALPSKQSFLEKYSTYKVEQPQSTVETYFDDNRSQMGLTELDEFVLSSTSEGRSGYVHHRYKQYHDDIQVYGAGYILHELDGVVMSGTGLYLPGVAIDTRPVLTAEDALEFALQAMDAEQYAWEVPSVGKKHKNKPVPSLVIADKEAPNFSGNYKLCYKMDVKSTIPIDGYTFLIDAVNGTVVKKIELLKGSAVKGIGKTRYYGEQEITVDSISPSEFILHDPTRGNEGITVYNDGGSRFKSSSSYFNLDGEEKDEVALDAHFTTAHFYDELRDNFDWLGLDNNNLSMNVSVHANGGQDFVNAYWDGEFAWFGDGDCNNGPLTTYEVVAHEFMHGVIDYTSELIYSDESGAINESLADVMGHYMEWVGDEDNFSWELRHSFALVDGLEPFRVMDDPTEVGDPDYYKGDFWVDGVDVHINSSIGNLMYVLLSDGGMGLANGDVPYNVGGLGKEEAAQFLFYVNRNYLTASSGYDSYYEASVLAADIFFAGNQDKIRDVEQAWKAVGLPSEQNPDVLSISISTSGVEWTCDYGEYASVSFGLINGGGLPLLSGNASVFIEAFVNGNFYDRTVPITTDILPGEQMTFTVDSFMILEDDFIIVDYDLSVTGQNNGVDRTNDFYIVTEHMRNDLSLNVRTDDTPCFQKELDFSFRIANASCETLPAGEEVTLFISDDNQQLLWSEIIVIERSLNPSGSYTVDRSIDLGINQSSILNYMLEFDGDLDFDNNTQLGFVTILEPITVGYYNGLNNEDDLYENSLLLETSSFGGNIYSNSSGGNFFTTGSFEDASGPLCADSDLNWNNELSFFSPITANISACVDLSGVDNSSLYFELSQYRRNFGDFQDDKSSSVRVAFTSGTERSIRDIVGQQEGQWKENRIPFPENFKGKLDIRFLTQTGVGANASDFLLYDVVMMDNLAILDQVSTYDIVDDSDVSLYPNPTSGLLQIETQKVISNVQVFDTQGRLMIFRAGNNRTIDVQSLISGFYNLLITDEKGQQHRNRFIKL